MLTAPLNSNEREKEGGYFLFATGNAAQLLISVFCVTSKCDLGSFTLFITSKYLTEKNGFVTGPKLGTTNTYFIAATKKFCCSNQTFC